MADSIDTRPQPLQSAKLVQPAMQTALYDAKCANCEKWTKVVFPPDGKRPVYCKACLKKMGRGPAPGPRTQDAPKPIIVRPAQPSQPAQVSQNVSLADALSRPAIPFSPSRRDKEEKPKPKRKEVNLDELKKALEKSLAKDTPDENIK
jgi:CxxC-x17-CxxC domain-containing protein